MHRAEAMDLAPLRISDVRNGGLPAPFARHLDPRSLRLFVLLAERAEGGVIASSAESLASALAVSADTITRAMDDLTAFGLAVRNQERDGGRFGPLVVRLLNPPASLPAAAVRRVRDRLDRRENRLEAQLKDLRAERAALDRDLIGEGATGAP